MKIIVQHIATAYEDEGAGPVMLFLHGWQDNLHTFDALASSLSSSYRIIRLDLPGFGKSEMPNGAWSVDDYVQFVADFVQKLNVRPDVLVGHSFGGRIGIKGAGTQKLHARKLILIGPAGIAKKRTFRNSILRVAAKVGRLVTNVPPFLFWRHQLRKKLYRFLGSDYFASGRLKETFLKIIAEDLRESAKQVTIPTLLIWGEHDTQTPLALGKELSGLIRGSTLKVVRDAGHFVHQEQPRRVVELIRAFL